jgi:peptidoglycan/xylan/chitin deacetylase (PgdA/CDA1 family)
MTAPLLVLLLVAGCAALFFWLNRREFASVRCPVLLYHRFIRDEALLAHYPGTESIFTITAERFDEEMRFLKGAGYSPVGLQQIVDFVREGRPLPPKPVALTVDDGWTSNIDIMLPILKTHGIKASFFITTSGASWIYRDFEGFDAPLSREQVAFLRSEGHEIGSHTVTHAHLIELDDDAVRREFTDSKRWIEESTGQPCPYLSIPGNFYDDRIMRIARECGYQAVFTANVGSVHASTSPWDIPRLIVEGNFSVAEFQDNLKPLTICTRKLIFAIKKMPPRIFGASRYMAIRERLFESPLRGLFIMRRLKMIALGMALLVLVALIVLSQR